MKKAKKKPKKPKKWTYNQTKWTQVQTKWTHVQTEPESEIAFEPQDFAYARTLARRYSVLIPKLLDAE